MFNTLILFTLIIPLREVTEYAPVLNDVQSQLPARHIYTCYDDITTVHECTHDINARLRNIYNKPCFYVLNNKAVVLDEPNTTLIEIANKIPISLRGDVYNLYLIQAQKWWNNQPSYIFDEFVAYTNGAQARKELNREDHKETIKYTSEFIVYSICVAWASNSEDPKLKAFLKWQIERAIQLGAKPNLKDKNLKIFIKKYFGSEWCEKVLFDIPDGSIIFWEGGFFVHPIYKYTGSKLTHVAIVLYHDDGPWAYEATWPRVRRMPLNNYTKHLNYLKQKPFWKKRKFNWFIIKPKQIYTESQLAAMKKYARSQLGRRYMMRGYWLNREVRGTMCSQYVGNILAKSGRIRSFNFKESPISLYKKLQPLYRISK